MNDFERLAYSDALRMPKAGDVVYIKYHNQPYRKERLVSSLDSGGEGNVFATENHGSMVVKLYHPEKLSLGRVEKITALAEEITNVNHPIFDYICWPKAMVYDYEGGHMIGYLMERVPPHAIHLADLIAQMYIGENPLHYKRRDLAELCKRIAEGFSQLHNLAGKRLLMCDVNPGNIMVTADPMQIYFVDLDSYQYESNAGKRLRCPVGRGEYTSPELFERMRSQNTVNYADVDRTEIDEAFAAAVLYFDILFLGQEPFERYGASYEDVIRQGMFVYRDGQPTSYIWRNLTPRLQEMFQGVFMNRKIYSDRDWIDAFTMLQTAIEEGRYSNLLRPDVSPISETDRIARLKCERCHNLFTGSVELHRNHYPYCRDCRRKIALEEKQCLRLTCSQCGQKFSINQADQKVDPKRQPICPDCDADYYIMRKQLFLDPKGDSQKLVALAIRNLEES